MTFSPHQNEINRSLWQMTGVGLSFQGPDVQEIDNSDAHEYWWRRSCWCSETLLLIAPLSAVTSLSPAAEAVTSNLTATQSAAHPPPRSITKHSGNRWEETTSLSFYLRTLTSRAPLKQTRLLDLCVSVTSWSHCWCVPLWCSSWSQSFWQQSCGNCTVRKLGPTLFKS